MQKSSGSTPILSYQDLDTLNDSEAKSLCQEFSHKLSDKKVRILFLLDNLPTHNPSGLEIASYRRAELLSKYCGVEPYFIFNFYQSSLAEDILAEPNLRKLANVHFINLYDFVQGIDRNCMHKQKVELALQPDWKVVKLKEEGDYIVLIDSNGAQMLYVHRKDEHSLDYVNYIRNDHIFRRDTYDPLGFLSRTELFDHINNFPHTAIFFRPDKTIALIETYSSGKKNNLVALPDSIHLLNREGFTVNCFCKREELISWGLQQLLSDQNTKYICVADQTTDYQGYFEALKQDQQSLNNVRMIAVVHNCHTVDPFNVNNSELWNNYAFLDDEKQRVDRIVTLTSWQRDDILKRFKHYTDAVTVIPHALPYTPDDLGCEDEGNSVLPEHALILIGRFAPEKNHLAAIDLIVKVRDVVPDATLHFYGTGENEAALLEAVKQRNLTEVVFFHGFQADLSAVYRSAALTLSLSKHEGFPLNILESLALGCPVVAFDCRYGPAEQIADGMNGFLLPYGDLDGAVDCCVKLLSDDVLRTEFRHQAQEGAKRFAPQKIAALWAKLMTEFCEN